MDFERFDRQSRTFGQNSGEKLYNSNVYIVCKHTDFLVIEVLKNLTLCGVQNIHLYCNRGVDFELNNYTTDINPSINYTESSDITSNIIISNVDIFIFYNSIVIFNIYRVNIYIKLPRYITDIKHRFSFN